MVITHVDGFGIRSSKAGVTPDLYSFLFIIWFKTVLSNGFVDCKNESGQSADGKVAKL